MYLLTIVQITYYQLDHRVWKHFLLMKHTYHTSKSLPGNGLIIPFSSIWSNIILYMGKQVSRVWKPFQLSKTKHYSNYLRILMQNNQKITRFLVRYLTFFLSFFALIFSTCFSCNFILSSLMPTDRYKNIEYIDSNCT